MKAFANYHPMILMLYFLLVTAVAMFVWNPVIQMFALIGGITFCISIQTSKEEFSGLGFYVLLFIMIVITNPLFSHNGVTILFYINGSPITLEAFIYGIAIAVMVTSVMFWFKCYSIIMTSDKFIYIFKKAIPKIALVLSMTLRFIPMFKRQIHEVNIAQKTMGLYSSKSYANKVRAILRAFSVMITWSLENTMDTAMSMKARGYGTNSRTSYSLIKFTKRDAVLLICVIVLGSITLVSSTIGKIDFYYYPRISALDLSAFSIITYISYTILALLPVIVEIKENLKWKYCISKI